MENNKVVFKRTGVMYNGAEVLEIQVNPSGDAARYRSVVHMASRDNNIVTSGRWQKIRYSKQGNAYISMYGKKLYLHKFQRTY